MVDRISTFKVDAESVQGIEGATLTIKCVKQLTWKKYLSEKEYGDAGFVVDHIVEWTGFVDENGKALPSLKDEPGAIEAIYMHETGRISALIAYGPDGKDALKN